MNCNKIVLVVIGDFYIFVIDTPTGLFQIKFKLLAQIKENLINNCNSLRL